MFESRSPRLPEHCSKAVVFNRDCGATTGFSTQISVLSVQDDLPNDGGNLLIVDGKHPLKPVWSSESALRIVGARPREIFKQERTILGVTVNYGQ